VQTASMMSQPAVTDSDSLTPLFNNPSSIVDLSAHIYPDTTPDVHLPLNSRPENPNTPLIEDAVSGPTSKPAANSLTLPPSRAVAQIIPASIAGPAGTGRGNVGTVKKTGIMRPNPHSTTAR
jgi:hypothetical protein